MKNAMTTFLLANPTALGYNRSHTEKRMVFLCVN